MTAVTASSKIASTQTSQGLTPVTGVVVACNEADRIVRCVESLRLVCAEVIVVDSGSTDGTRELAAKAGARVIVRAWPGFAAQKNFAIESAATDWVLLLDADEWVTPELAEEIRTLLGEPQRLQAHAAFSMRRRNHFLGRELTHGGWGRERLVRLLRRECRYLDMRVHERLDLSGKKVGRLRAGILHETYRDLAEYQRKLTRYAELFAEDRHAAGKRASLFDLLLRPAVYFVRNYLVRGGFLDGLPGLMVDRFHAHYVFTKYALLWEKGRGAVRDKG
jgi:(heptosyl)LPS beta-1,4-glucosyltransferase